MVSNLVTVVGGSCKRRDAFQDTQFAKIKEDLENGVRRSGQGLNQEKNLKRPGDTRWGSYFRILHFLPQIELADNHLIQLAIERVKRLILTHFELFKPSG